MKRLAEMDEVELRLVMNRVAMAVESKLPEMTRFIVLAFDDAGIAQYVARGRRAETILALRETADRLERKQDVSRLGTPELE